MHFSIKCFKTVCDFLPIYECEKLSVSLVKSSWNQCVNLSAWEKKGIWCNIDWKVIRKLLIHNTCAHCFAHLPLCRRDALCFSGTEVDYHQRTFIINAHIDTHTPTLVVKRFNCIWYRWVCFVLERSLNKDRLRVIFEFEPLQME